MGPLKQKANNRILGLGISLFAPLLVLFGFNQYMFPELNFFQFIRYANEFQTLGTWLKPSVLINLAFFILFINLNKLRTAQGIVFGTILYALYIAYLTLSA